MELDERNAQQHDTNENDNIGFSEASKIYRDIYPIKNDCLLKAARGERGHRIPVWTMRQAGRYLPEYRAFTADKDFFSVCRRPEWACEVTLQPLSRFDIDAVILFSDILVVPQALGMEVQMLPAVGPVFPKPLKSLDDWQQVAVAASVWNLDVDDILQERCQQLVTSQLSYVMSALSLIRHNLQGRVPLIGFCGSPWTLFVYMTEGKSSRLFAECKKWLYKWKKESHGILRVLTELCAQFLIQQVKSGAQILQVFDSHGGELTPSTWKEFSFFYLDQLASKVKSECPDVPIIVFSKGAHHAIQLLSSSSFDVVSSDFKMDLGACYRIIRDAGKSVQGNLDPAALYASVPEIKSITYNMIQEVSVCSTSSSSLTSQQEKEESSIPKGYIANLGHGMNPDHDVTHLDAFVTAVHEWGLCLRSHSKTKQANENDIVSHWRTQVDEFEKYVSSPSKHQFDTLSAILRRNADSEIGKRCGFKHITSAEEYANAVSFGEFKDMESAIERQRAGHSALFCDTYLWNFKTPGTTGTPKLIPASQSSFPFHFQASSRSDAITFLQHSGVHKRDQVGAHAFLIASSGTTRGANVPFSALSTWCCEEELGKQSSVMPDGKFTFHQMLSSSPPVSYMIEDFHTTQRLHLLFALLNRNMFRINGFFASSAYLLLKSITEDGFEFAEAIDRRVLPESFVFPDLATENAIAEIFAQRCAAINTYERAKEIRIAIENEQNHDIIPRLWPELQFITCMKSGTMATYVPRIRELTGNKVFLQSGFYSSSEGCLGYPLNNIFEAELPQTLYVPAGIDGVYLEYLPLKEGAVPVPLSKVNIGDEYEIVVTNSAGLYRCRLGDTVKFVNHYQGCPVFELLGRTASVLNVNGERLSELQMMDALLSLQRVEGIQVTDFTFAADPENMRYIAFVEFANDEDYKRMALKGVGAIDACLGSVNSLYGSYIRNGAMESCRLVEIPKGGFQSKLRNHLVQASGAAHTGFKVPRVIDIKGPIFAFLDNLGFEAEVASRIHH